MVIKRTISIDEERIYIIWDFSFNHRYLFPNNFIGNIWEVITDRRYIIPSESTMLRFKVIRMNEGSGDWWLYGEDDNNYYTMMDATNEKPYLLISKHIAKDCKNFDLLNFKTWCNR
jgi:hypothetical protein